MHSYRVLIGTGHIRSLTLTVHTNNAATVNALLARHGYRLNGVGWSVRVRPWSATQHTTKGGKAKPNNFMLAHAHLDSWTTIVADPTSNATSFIHLEDDVCPRVEGLVSWAEDEALLLNSGAASSGFQRGFYRFEVTRHANEMPPPGPNSRYSHEYISRRAAWWRGQANVSFGERFVLDERIARKYSPIPPRTCDELPCDPMVNGTRSSSSWRWCANYPTLVIMKQHPHQQPRVFASLANPYSAMTAASRPLLEAFLLRSRGWNLWSNGSDGDSFVRVRSGDSMRRRTRHKAYATREYGSCTFHYAHEFVRFEEMPINAKWPAGEFGSTLKHGQGMRRVLVPLVLRTKDKRGRRSSSWQLDTLAGVHHQSDRVVNGPRKGGNEQFAARFRESELMRCGK